MTDHELSNLLQEWKRTPAPPSLSVRVFGSRRPPSPHWGDRIPASLTAVTGALVGGLAVWVLIALAPTQPIQRVPAVVPPAAVEEPVAKELPPVRPLPQTARATKPARRTKPAAPPTPKNLATMPPRLISAPVPMYPADLPPLALATTLKLRIHIGKDGRVIDAEIIEGDPLLNSFAIEAVKAWFYEPRLENGEPAETVTQVDVVFEPIKKK